MQSEIKVVVNFEEEPPPYEAVVFSSQDLTSDPPKYEDQECIQPGQAQAYMGGPQPTGLTVTLPQDTFQKPLPSKPLNELKLQFDSSRTKTKSRIKSQKDCTIRVEKRKCDLLYIFQAATLCLYYMLIIFTLILITMWVFHSW